MLTQLLNHVSKEQCSRGEYWKNRRPGRRKFIDGGLFRVLTRAGREVGARARQFRGAGGPVTNTMPSKWIRSIHKSQVSERSSPREKTHRCNPQDKSCNARRPEYDIQSHAKFSMEPTKEEWPSAV